MSTTTTVIKTLKSLEQHNKEVLDSIIALNSIRCQSGIACPKCGEEMLFSNLNAVVTTDPPKRNVHCNKCNHRDYVY